MSSKSAKYNFDTNLINASYEKVLENAKKEWKTIYEQERLVEDGLCICQRKVKHVIYMFNIKTNKTICVGSSCHKKFNMERSLVDKNLASIFKNYLEKGEYKIIDNIVIYCQSVQNDLITVFESKYINYCQFTYNRDNGYKIDEKDYVPCYLINTLREINVLIMDYKLEYLRDIYTKFTNKIDEIYNERKAYEESKIYTVIITYSNYIQGNGSDICYRYYYYTSLEQCNKHILESPPVGVTEYLGYGYTKRENTYLKYEILCKKQTIQIIEEKKVEKKEEKKEDRTNNNTITNYFKSLKV